MNTYQFQRAIELMNLTNTPLVIRSVDCDRGFHVTSTLEANDDRIVLYWECD